MGTCVMCSRSWLRVVFTHFLINRQTNLLSAAPLSPLSPSLRCVQERTRPNAARHGSPGEEDAGRVVVDSFLTPVYRRLTRRRGKKQRKKGGHARTVKNVLLDGGVVPCIAESTSCSRNVRVYARYAAGGLFGMEQNMIALRMKRNDAVVKPFLRRVNLFVHVQSVYRKTRRDCCYQPVSLWYR